MLDSRAHVFIATTQGPVSILRIQELPPTVPSLVCKDLMHKNAAISNSYREFVAPGSGIIAVEFGHGSFRMDIKGEIHCGESWNFAVHLAHQLSSVDRLGDGTIRPGDQVIWATGIINAKRELVKISELESKLRHSQTLFGDCLDKGIPLFAFIPADNVSNIPTDWNENPLWTAANITLSSHSSIPDVLTSLGIESVTVPDPTGSEPVGVPAGSGARQKRQAITVSVAAFLLAGLIFYAGPDELMQQFFSADAKEKGSHVSNEERAEPAPVRAPESEGAATPPPKSENVEASDPGSVTPPHKLPDASQKQQSLAIDLVAAIAPCQRDDSASQVLPLGQDLSFEPVSLSKACTLRLVPRIARQVAAVHLLGLDSGKLIRLERNDTTWVIPIPKNTEITRTYALIVSPTGELAREDELGRRLQVKLGQDALDASSLRALLKTIGWQAHVFTHELIADS